MKKKRIINNGAWISLVVFMTLAAGAVLAAPPKVKRTVPRNAKQDVDPSLQEIHIEFDQDMNRGGYSICGSGPNFPKIIGKPRWVNARAIVVRVKLVPNHKYTLSINSRSYKNFKSIRGEPAIPYPITFKTAPGPRNAPAGKLRTGDNAQAVRELRRAIDEDYSYRDRQKIDWDGLFVKHSRAMKQAGTAKEFAEAAAMLLAHAKDMHIWLVAGDDTIRTFKRDIRRNYNLNTLENEIPGWGVQNNRVTTGRFDDGIGYIMIRTWSSERSDEMKAAYEALQDFSKSPGLIIDVRPNGGGAEPLAQQFAGCFVGKPAVYAKHVYRDANQPRGFGKTRMRVLQPNKERPRYSRKIAVLMGPANMSSCEAFLLMMKRVPGCKLIGETSFGSSGNPKPVELGNDVTVFLPSWKALRLDGSCFEGEGITPDVTVRTNPAELLEGDPVLTAALNFLRGNRRSGATSKH